jgi:cell division protein FtsB
VEWISGVELMQTAVKKANEWAQAKPSGQRTVKMQGNVAYISSDLVRQNRPETGVKTAPKTPAKKVARPAAKRNAKPAVNTAPKPSAKAEARPRAGFISTLIVLLVAFGALAVLVSRYAAVCSIGTQNNTIEKNIAALEAQMDELQLKIEMDDDLQKVQEKAVGELGMTYPTPEQKISIDQAANGE